MKDMFGNVIAVGDTIIIASRTSNQSILHVAIVLKTTARDARVNVVGGNDHEFRAGKIGKWDNVKLKYSEQLPCTGWVSTVWASWNIMIANGLDVAKMRADIAKIQAPMVAQINENIKKL